jgi:tRNA G18 (ribose-2'-O)-methylase SpoU
MRGNMFATNNIPLFSLVLPNIRSAHNVGAFFRTADGAGVTQIFITGYSPQPPHPGLVKVSLGAENSVPWYYVRQTARLLKKLSAQGIQIVGLEQARNSVTLESWQPTFPVCLVVGNEVTGLPLSLRKLCDVLVEIPMRGIKNSLNVSVAGGIALYHISRYLRSQSQ